MKRAKTKTGQLQPESYSLAVPENRTNPVSRSITFPFYRFQSTSRSPLEPIFHLTGGPGMSNLKFRPSEKILKNHDVVLVGYRGADGSAILDCPEISRAMKGIDGQLFSARAKDAMAEAVRVSAERLQRGGCFSASA